MKNLVKFYSALGLLILLQNNVKAQSCNYVIMNNIGCGINVTVDWYDTGAIPCYSWTGLINPGNMPLNCSGCAGITDVKVTVNTVSNSAPSSPVVATKANSSVPVSSTVSSGCYTGNVVLTWNPNSSNVTP